MYCSTSAFLLKIFYFSAEQNTFITNATTITEYSHDEQASLYIRFQDFMKNLSMAIANNIKYIPEKIRKNERFTDVKIDWKVVTLIVLTICCTILIIATILFICYRRGCNNNGMHYVRI